jgi:hypothetical protein
MELTDRQKKIAWKAYWHRGVSIYAAVEAVLADQGQTCAGCGCQIKMCTHCEPCYQARASEQPLPRVKAPEGFGVSSTQPPAEDVVERISIILNPIIDTAIKEDYPNDVLEGITAALAVAREDMVPREQYQMLWEAAQNRIEDHKQQLANMASHDAVEKAIHEELDSGWGLKAEQVKSVIYHILRRLTKPAKQRVHIQQSGSGDYLIILDGNFCFRLDKKQDAERYAAGLREELKAGKQ